MQKTIKALPWIQRGVIFAAFLFGLAALGAASAQAGEVTNLNDSGPGSLRQAITDAATDDTITFAVNGTITLTSGALTIDKNLVIEGPGPQYLKISGNHASRVFVILPNKTVMLAGMTISDGLADGISPTIPSFGGAILNGAIPITPQSIANTRLTLFNLVVSNNQALGDATKAPLNYPGAAYGGAICNVGTLIVNDSTFIRNLARGANGISNTAITGVAGFGAGGGIFSAGKLTVINSGFNWNQAIGGNQNSSAFLTGHGFGGAIVAGGVLGDMVVQQSEFGHNQAIGGDGNISPKPPAVGANKASGGAIDVVGGKAVIDGCNIHHNWSIGGAGAAGAYAGIGAGGAIVATNFSNQGTNVTVMSSNVKHNLALGGPGSLGQAGGEGQGGGLVSTATAILKVIDTTVAQNNAQGGPGGNGGDGGNGLGGGLYDHANSSGAPPPPPGDTVLMLQGSIVTQNLALGGEEGDGGNDGQGIGGGVYYLGSFTCDNATVIKKNQATTSNDNVGP